MRPTQHTPNWRATHLHFITLFLVACLLLTPAAPGSNAQASPSPAMQTAPADIFATSPVRLPTDSTAPALAKKEMSAALVPLHGIVQVVTGAQHTCALTTTGGVKCWGENGDGQLGTGAYNNAGDVVGLGSGVVAIAAGHRHTCALTIMGGVKCWGSNYYGQLGYGNFEPYQRTPVDVVGLGSGVAAITAAYRHTCALTTAGGVKCWGNNDYGQLGNVTSWYQVYTPVDVSGLDIGVAAITAGGTDYGHTCALTTSGGVKCWGSNAYGQLGDGTDKVYKQFTPVDVVGLGLA